MLKNELLCIENSPKTYKRSEIAASTLDILNNSLLISEVNYLLLFTIFRAKNSLLLLKMTEKKICHPN